MIWQFARHHPDLHHQRRITYSRSDRIFSGLNAAVEASKRGGVLTADNRNSSSIAFFLSRSSPCLFPGMKIFFSNLLSDHLSVLCHALPPSSSLFTRIRILAHLPEYDEKRCSLRDRLLHLLLLLKIWRFCWSLSDFSKPLMLRSFVLFCAPWFIPGFSSSSFPAFRSVFEGSPWKSWKYYWTYRLFCLITIIKSDSAPE